MTYSPSGATAVHIQLPCCFPDPTVITQTSLHQIYHYHLDGHGGQSYKYSHVHIHGLHLLHGTQTWHDPSYHHILAQYPHQNHLNP